MIPEAAAGSIKSARLGLEFIEAELADGRAFLCGDRFSLADIALYTRFVFFAAKDPSQKGIASGLPSFAAYIARVKARPSAAAIIPQKSKM